MEKAQVATQCSCAAAAHVQPAHDIEIIAIAAIVKRFGLIMLTS
jgi:hypothetical protein